MNPDLRAACSQILRVQQAKRLHDMGFTMVEDTLYTWGGFEVEATVEPRNQVGIYRGSL